MLRHFGPILLCAVTLGCETPRVEVAQADLTPPLAGIGRVDFELQICRQRLAQVRAEPTVGGAPEYDAKRVEILGRAMGEPALFVSTPEAQTTKLTKDQQTARVAASRASSALRPLRWLSYLRNDKPSLRKLVLRQGYVFSDDPIEAFALVKHLTLPDLFDEPSIVLQRGDVVYPLTRSEDGKNYLHEGGRVAKLLFADRVAVSQDQLGAALHRDIRSLRDREGFSRMRIEHFSRQAMVAELRYGHPQLADSEPRWVTALIDSDGAHLEIACLDAPREQRADIAAFVASQAPHRRALAALQSAADKLVEERMPFDRPHGAEDHLTDGVLRPSWERAYRKGQQFFNHEGSGYPVYDDQGRPTPPQMCVQTIIESFERASGTWYRLASEPHERTVGNLDFSQLGLVNRAGVLAFGIFAEEHPEIFIHRLFEERIPFKYRERFFGYLVEHADDLMAGDIISIQGPKPDGYVHQHAILINDVDPLTGFPYKLTDQMSKPRHRTFEAIMGEAPMRALLYHVRLRPEYFLRLDPDYHPPSGAGLRTVAATPTP